MEDNFNKALQKVIDGNLGDSIRIISDVLRNGNNRFGYDRLESISIDYHLMLNYLERGYQDEQRYHLYGKLLRKMYSLIADMETFSNRRNVSSYVYALQLAGNLTMSHDFVRSVLEGFVSDVAMTSLKPEDERESASIELYNRHQIFVSRLFCGIWTSFQWSRDDCEFYSDLLSSPTIDANDAQLLISAVMLGAIQRFDPYKFMTLLNVYRSSSDKRIRQRSFVGWVFSLHKAISLFPEVKEMVEDTCNLKSVRRELLELQMQVVYCLNAERDNEAIQRDIMPTIMKNNNFTVTRFGIIEKEEDPLQDILHPDAEDKAMAELEDSINKMVEMQKAGSDIYFGGFSQMKSYPFFGTMPNWFCPFYPEHPGLSSISKELRESKFLTILFNRSYFCDSDRYSFALALSSVVGKLPSNMRELLNQEDVLFPSEGTVEEHSSAHVRRMYLQDLYRFYKLFQYRNDLVNPFGKGRGSDDDKDSWNALVFCQDIFAKDSFDDQKLKLGQFLMKQKRIEMLSQLLATITPQSNPLDLYLLKAYFYMYQGKNAEAHDCFEHVLTLDSAHERAKKGLSRVCMLLGKYDEAERWYAELLRSYPENRNYELNRSVALLKLERVDEAVEVLYKLNYNYPDDDNVSRVLAWGLLCKDKFTAANKIYNTLLSCEKPAKEDYINAGYCHWFLHEMEEAVSLFRAYRDNAGGDVWELESVFLEDKVLLERNGITKIDRHLMLDLILQN